MIGLQAGTPMRLGTEAVRSKGWWKAQRFLLLRRFSQVGILLLFLSGPWWGLWIAKGNLSASLTLGVLPLTDPFALAQTLATGHWPQEAAWGGLLIVIAFYGLLAGRAYCAWVCPVNVLTDFAAWLRHRLGIRSGRTPLALRYWLIPTLLLASALSGLTVWEWVNPVSLTHRALIFGGYGALAAALAVFLYDLLVAPRGWCARLCPVGASYALLGRKSLVRVSAQHSSACNDCAECFAVCPEPHIIPAALKGKEGASPLILSADCTLCGRCVDVCAPDVFVFTHRFNPQRV